MVSWKGCSSEGKTPGYQYNDAALHFVDLDVIRFPTQLNYTSLLTHPSTILKMGLRIILVLVSSPQNH